MIAIAALAFGFALVQLRGSNAVVSGYPGSDPTAPASGNLIYHVYMPVVMKNYKSPPPATDSLYIITADLGTHYRLGQSYGSTARSGLVILDFGNPRVLSGPRYCTKLLGQSIFPCIPEITAAVQNFLSGWWYGYFYQGGSTRNPDAFVTVGIGLNNCGTGGVSTNPSNPCVPGGSDMPSEHGRAWAQMVRSLADWSTSQGYSSRLAVAAANDMEPGWNYNTLTSQWVTGYNDYFVYPISPVLLYNFGSCDGCSYARTDHTICTACVRMDYVVTTTTGTVTWSWYMSDILYVSWGATYNWPVPQIYLDQTNARQWYGASRYTFDTRGSPMRFQGALTTSKRYGNSPEAGWEQLWGWLYDDPSTRLTDIPWSTDIDFQR